MLKRAIIIADSSELFRRALSELLKAAGWDVAGVAGHGDEALELAAAHPDSIVIIDEALVRGGELLAKLRAKGHSRDAIVLNGSWDIDAVVETLAAGASGFIDRDSAPEQLLAAIELVSGGGMAFSTRVAVDLRGGLAEVFDLVRQRNLRRLNLTPREAEVLKLLPTSLTLGQIAVQLFVSRKTVQNNVSSLYRKLDRGRLGGDSAGLDYTGRRQRAAARTVGDISCPCGH
jgi:DNA-binding NarL/FixJ family response regulator